MRLRDRWPTVPLGTLAEFRNGVNYNKSNFGTGIKVIGVSDFQDHVRASYDQLEQINPEGVVRKEHLLRDGDILFVRSNGNRDLIGRSLFVDGVRENVTHSAFSIRLRFTSPECCSPFYAYLFRSTLIRQALSMFGGGTNISNLNQGILEQLQVLLPTKPTQERVAGILSAYDDLIENNTRRIKIREEMAQMLYREWFVNFRFPGHESVKMVESELGPRPEGWLVKALGEVAAITMGLSPKGDTYNEEGDGSPLINGPVEFGERFTKAVKWTTAPTKLCKEGDLIVCVRGSTTGRYVKSDGIYCLGRGVCGLSSQYQCFVDLLFGNELPTLLAKTSGSTFPSWTGPQLKSHLVLCPPFEVLERFETIVRPMSGAVVLYSRKIQNLRTTRDFLLPKLISGEVSVEAAEDAA
jgi:type I restriction enzyme S subunit